MIRSIFVCSLLIAGLVANAQNNKSGTTSASATASQKVAVQSGGTAEDIRNRYIAAVGGAEAISAIKDVKMTYSASMQGMDIAFTDWKSGGRMKREVSAMGNVVQKSIFADNAGRMESQGQTKAMSGEQLSTAKRDADIQAILHPNVYGMKRVFVKDSADLHIVNVTNQLGATGQEYYSIASGLLVREVHTTQGPQGVLPVVVEYADYKEVPGSGGYRVPYTILQKTGDQSFEAHVQTVEINTGIAESEFK